MSKARKNTPFIFYDGTFWVWIRATGIQPLIPYIDGMRIAAFPQTEWPCIRLDDAIAWHEEELATTNGACGSEKFLGLLRIARERLIAAKAARVTAS